VSTEIREATESDLPRLAELLFQLSQRGEIPEREEHPPGATEQRALRELRSDPRSACLVLDVDGRVEGTFSLYLLPNLSHDSRPFAIVESVVVDESCRGSGFGRLLMERAESLARAAGCYKIALTSNRKRADAHRFYEGLGYKPTHQGFTKYFDLE
jgi:GNAT superfamily N-acetyltransferase